VDATRARLAYGAVGAYVTFEVYEGLGHQTPVRASRLADWLVVQARLGGREAPAAVQSTFKQACQDAYRTADAVTDQAARYRALRPVAEDPRLPWCGEAVYRGVWTKLAEAARSPAVQTEWGAEQEFMKIVQVESTARRLEDMAQVAKRLAALRTEAGLTLYGRIAGSFLEPYQDAYARALAATAAARQNAPGTPATLRPKATGGPSVGGSQVRQVREGNRVIFERD